MDAHIVKFLFGLNREKEKSSVPSCNRNGGRKCKLRKSSTWFQGSTGSILLKYHKSQVQWNCVALFNSFLLIGLAGSKYNNAKLLSYSLIYSCETAPNALQRQSDNEVSIGIVLQLSSRYDRDSVWQTKLTLMMPDSCGQHVQTCLSFCQGHTHSQLYVQNKMLTTIYLLCYVVCL